MGRSGDEASTASVSYRRADDLSEVAREWTAAGIDELTNATPWRTFRWYRGQKHYSGSYWSSTVGGHVIYESRLELARLLFADFDTSVQCIIAQPFLLRTSVDRKSRKHIPDYLLITDNGPVVVDVKPAHRLADPKVTFTFEWTRELIESRGWRYEVATEPIAVELANVRFLAGYRRGWLFRSELLAQLRQQNLDGSPLADALSCLPEEPIQHVKAAVLHLLWRQELLIDLSKPLSRRTELRRPG
ncbi:TnsA-like heteromeric transposase endonuclease subunit [Mycolicibacterium sp. 120266]|uniref:TnsA-like heteromeric transposase endonuclease subunit n=1 Tax=Mycolicibacterium sp. 120266 TaxID=3090601 RepID=UPI00299CE6F3|nr:TnsA-like heteromeric transposase endonuclease subunit [Mycolicibacterium sp. 120266]MDX1873283.1 TnsA-like heteromeric transposase endonuclease subunit [Mycolicibacterium sp. 120266]